jgi:hypothetical protein
MLDPYQKRGEVGYYRHPSTAGNTHSPHSRENGCKADSVFRDVFYALAGAVAR